MRQTIRDSTSTPTEPEFYSPSIESMNIATSDTTQLQILQLLREIQVEMRANYSNITRTGDGTRNTDGNENENSRSVSRRNRKTPETASFSRTITDEYCWKHGACNHSSEECNRKASGNKCNVTLSNYQDGSNAYCNPNP